MHSVANQLLCDCDPLTDVRFFERSDYGRTIGALERDPGSLGSFAGKKIGEEASEVGRARGLRPGVSFR